MPASDYDSTLFAEYVSYKGKNCIVLAPGPYFLAGLTPVQGLDGTSVNVIKHFSSSMR
jgi:hypothetical protein